MKTHTAPDLIKEPTQPPSAKGKQMESVSFWILEVTVVRARTKKRQDFFTKSDLYVTLSLPTASTITRRTKTISNNQQPEWNEAFSFRIPSQTKNILELSVFDKDIFTSDDHVSTVLLDVGTVGLGSKVSRHLTLDPKTEDVLELELELKSSPDETVRYPSNGILLAPPLSALDVSVTQLQQNHIFKTGCTPTLRLSGAFEELLEIEEKKMRFHLNRDLQTELELTEGKLMSNAKKKRLSAVTLKPLPPQFSGKVSLTLDKDTVDLLLEAQEIPSEHLAVRLDHDVPPQEKEFLQKRKVVVAKAVQNLLGLKSSPSDKQVPVIAVVASGGGARACVATLGSLRGLKQLGVLDAVTYISAVSGGTWGVSRIYQDENWSQNLDTNISKLREQMAKDIKSAFTVEKLKYYHKEMEERERQGHLVSFVDMAGLMVEHLVYGQKNNSTLSDQQKSLKNGQHPLPIYTAVNSIKAEDGLPSEAEWVEFTPFEVGLQKYGAFVKVEDFGSKFFLGHLIKKLPEIRLPFLIGIWSSIFSYTLETILKKLIGSKPKWSEDETIIHTIEEDNSSTTLDTMVLTPDAGASAIFSGSFQDRPILNQTANFTRGLSLHRNYALSNNFHTSKDPEVDVFPNKLTPSEPNLRLIDSGLSIKIACPSVLRPERLADVLIILSNGWDPDKPFDVLEKTDKFCEEHKVPFPRLDYAQLQQQPLKEIYVFEDPKTSKAPIVLFLPLVNDSFKKYKAPGVPRETPEEQAQGEVDVSSENSPYTTSNFTYSASDYDSLINLTSYNVLNSKDTILSSIRRALNRK